MYEVRQNKEKVSHTISSSERKRLNTINMTIQRQVPTDPDEEPHPAPATGSYVARQNQNPFDKNIHKRSMFSFGSRTRDEVFSRPEFNPQIVGNHVVAIQDSSGQFSNVEGIQLDHKESWENIADTMHSHNEKVNKGEQKTYYTVYEARMYYNDQPNLHPVLGALNASAGSMGVALIKYPNPNIAPYIGELQTSWMNFQNYIASGIIESGGQAETEIISRLLYIKNQLDSIIEEQGHEE
ncbi:hypothetical protein [Phocaeicola barnesiae]|uniref:hypothetical protein n=1 Tax=Phocaeicola barnesiae TaxID=376804 RepID=UPI0025A3C392|nr:hypothetical protein [Phocaeicola barnesiae]MDM8309031.1 hypothetical protein [Phocaeicola barnesiae]